MLRSLTDREAWQVGRVVLETTTAPVQLARFGHKAYIPTDEVAGRLVSVVHMPGLWLPAGHTPPNTQHTTTTQPGESRGRHFDAYVGTGFAARAPWT